MRSRADDPALAHERTALAWQRSALALTTLAGTALAAAAHRDELAFGLPAALVLAALGLAVLRHGRRLYTARLGRRTDLADPAGIHLVALATAVAALLAALLVTAGH